MSTFRLATINVHSFRNPRTYDANISDLVSILEPLDLDLIAVQEIQNDDKWQKFCQRLHLTNFIHGPCDRSGFFANGIATRHPIIFHSNQSENFLCSGGRRAFLQCRLGGDHPFIQDRLFAVTHLDHIDENDRLKQMKYFQPHEQNIDILMGDMNALTREDYSDDYFQQMVVRKREEFRWEKPRFDLTHLVRDQWNYQDALKLTNSQLKDEQLATCAYGTRIDYIFVHPRVNEQWKLVECSIIDSNGATDHNAVVAEFRSK